MDTITITISVGGPVWAAWMLTQGRKIEGAFEGDKALQLEGPKLKGWAGLSTLEKFLLTDGWREYKPPQEPQGWDWAFAEMQAGRVVKYENSFLLKIVEESFYGKGVGAPSDQLWRVFTLRSFCFTGKKWTSADES